MEFIRQNVGNIAVGILIAGALVFVIIRLVNFRKGKTGCGCGCGGAKSGKAGA
jgi:hypothetical protein